MPFRGWVTALCYLSAHDALTLLCSSFAIPRLLYLLRSASFFPSSLAVYDSVLMSILSKVANTQFETNGVAWLQASLPVKFGSSSC